MEDFGIEKFTEENKDYTNNDIDYDRIMQLKERGFSKYVFTMRVLSEQTNVSLYSRGLYHPLVKDCTSSDA